MTRRIFRYYYQLANMPIPDYFSDGLCDDFGENARSKWAKLYLTQKKDFLFRKDKNSLLFDITKLTTFNGFSNDSVEEYRNALPVELCVDGINGKNGKFVEIKAPAFYNWIGIENPQLQPVADADNDDQGKDKEADENDEKPAEKPQKEPKKKKHGFWARLFG